LVAVNETVWSIEPHTKAKHQILKDYLKGWFPILSTRQGRIIYLDGFAGPGIYAGGEEGSPVIALRTAISHKLTERFNEIVFAFIEKDKERARKLGEVIKSKFPNTPKNFKIEVLGAEFAPTLDSVLNELEKRGVKLAPTFAFLDPFGFSGFPMKLVRRLLSYDKTEVLITFMVDALNRFAVEHPDLCDELFDTPKWRDTLKSRDTELRERQLVDLYVKQLKEANVPHVRTFQMIGQQNRPIYYLVYGTKHWKGMEVMKEAMWNVDRRGTYSFSDITDPGQSFLIDYSNESVWVPPAAGLLYNHFHGQTVSLEAVHRWVVVATRYCFRKAILKHLQKSGRITAVKPQARKFTYPAGCQIRFAS